MKPDRKVLEKVLECLRVQVREIEELLEKPKVVTRIYLETTIEFDDSPVPEKDIAELTSEIESALSDAAESVDGVHERDADVSVEVSSVDREEVDDDG